MIKTFQSKALKELWTTSRTAKINGRLHERILRRLDVLNTAKDVDDLNIPGFNYHPVSGWSPTRYSIHVNEPWCLIFCFLDGDVFDLDFVQYH